MFEAKNLIAGAFVPSVTGEWLDRHDPLTGKLFTRVADSDVLDVVRAVQAAHRAWPAWSRATSADRVAVCRTIADNLIARMSEIVQANCEETGATLAESRNSAERTAETFRYLADHCEAISLSSEPSQCTHPLGLVGLITPVYDPIRTLGTRVAAALISGNTVIAKPSSWAARTAALFAEIVQSSGLASGVFNLVQGRGERVGQTIAGHPGVVALSFAGRTATGIRVHQAGAELLKRTQLSLGGSNPILVFEGVEIAETAARVARLVFSGEIAMHLRGSRLLVQASISKAFLNAVLSELELISKKIGDPRVAQTRLGPLARTQDRARFIESISRVGNERGKILFGGTESPAVLSSEFAGGNFVQPTLIDDLTACSTLYQEEVLGPLALVRTFKYAHDAIKYANNSPFALGASVFHPSAADARQVASRIEAARIWINPQMTPSTGVETAYDGIKMSGFGGEGGTELVAFFSREVRLLRG